MVSREIINNVFEDIISNIKFKCHPTISEMHTTLDKISYHDQYSQLKEKSLLNPLEIEHYQRLLTALENKDKDVNDPKMRELYEKNDMLEGTLEDIENINNQLFKYGRRLIEGLKINPVPDIDKNSFHKDNQYGSVNSLLENIGNLEQGQIDAQKKVFTKDNTSREEIHSMDWYFTGDLNNLNKTIYGFDNIYGKHFAKKLNYEQQKNVKDIDGLMDRSQGLLQDTVLYRVGHWDIHLNPGDHAKWKGYTSTTYQEGVINAYKEDHHAAMKIIIHAPKGTKGIAGNNPPVFDNGIGEHEYALPRNTGYTVLSIDYETMTAEIVLD